MNREEAKALVVDRVRRLDSTSRTDGEINGYRMGMIYALKHAGVVEMKDHDFAREVKAELEGVRV